MKQNSKISVKGTEITVYSDGDLDFISLTDMLRAKEGDFFISDWLRNRNTVEFLGIWEQVHNPAFNYGEFATIKSQAGQTAIHQMKLLLADRNVKQLEEK
jgi:KilA-N domain.